MSIARHSRKVSLLRRSLWGLVACVVALLVWIASDGGAKGRVVFSNITASAAALETMKNMMGNPHYQGVDARNRPYTVMADKAVQIDDNTVELSNIRADIGLENNVWVAMNAGSGTLNLATKQLQLTGGVDIFYDNGYEFRTPTAHVDIEQGSAYGEEPVEGQGPMGTLKATGFALLDHGKTIIFNQSVTITFYR